jgi:hypothetical protein
MPKKAYDLATDINIVGCWEGEINCKYLYDNLRDIDVKYDDFKAKCEGLKWGEVYKIKGKID